MSSSASSKMVAPAKSGWFFVSDGKEKAAESAASAPPSATDTKTISAVKHLLSMGSSKGAGDSKGASRRDPYKIQLVGQYVLTSAAATALTAVQALSPIGVSDFSSMAALFDLWRCKKVTITARLTGSGAPLGSGEWAFAFDPSNVGSYATVGDVMTARHKSGPYVFAGSTVTMFPAIMNRTGFVELKAALIDQPILNDGAAAAAVGGGWVGTSDTTAVVGWFKPVVNSFGPALTSTLSFFVTYDCEFKSRT